MESHPSSGRMRRSVWLKVWIVCILLHVSRGFVRTARRMVSESDKRELLKLQLPVSYTEAELETLDRRTLQKLAKENAIKANQKTEVLKQALSKAAHSNQIEKSQVSDAYNETPALASLTLHESTHRILKEQGIQILDLLDLRKSAIGGRRYNTSTAPKASSSALTLHEASSPVQTDSRLTDQIHQKHSPKKPPKKHLKVPTTSLNPITQAVEAAEKQRNRLLEGVTLHDMLSSLIHNDYAHSSNERGFQLLYKTTHVRSFAKDNGPSLASALVLLRKPEMRWARRKIEDLYLQLTQKR